MLKEGIETEVKYTYESANGDRSIVLKKKIIHMEIEIIGRKIEITETNNVSYFRISNKATHFLNPKFFQSSLIFICNPGSFSAL